VRKQQAKKPSPEELAERKAVEEEEKKIEAERARIERIRSAEDTAIARTSKHTVAAAHVAGVALVKGQDMRTLPAQVFSVDDTGQLMPKKTHHIIDHNKIVSAQVGSKQFWTEDLKPRTKELPKSGSLPSVQSKKSSREMSRDCAPKATLDFHEDIHPKHGTQQAQETSNRAMVGTVLPDNAVSSTTHEREKGKEKKRSPTAISPDTSVSELYVPELIKKVHVPEYDHHQLSLDAPERDGSLPKRYKAKKPLRPLRDAEDRHRLFFTGTTHGPVQDGVVTTRALNNALREQSTRMTRAKMLQAVEANKLAQIVGYTGAAIQVMMNPKHVVNRAEVDAATDTNFDVDDWHKLRPDVVQKNETFHKAGVSLSGRYVSEKGRKYSDEFRADRGEWEEAVAVHHAHGGVYHLQQISTASPTTD
jgi:hypothetical protein